MKCIYIILPLTLFTISCANTPIKPDHKEFFVTHIEKGGTKKFSYSLVTSTSNNTGNKQSKFGGRSGRGGKGGNRKTSNQASGQRGHRLKMEKKLFRKLEKILFDKAYCHGGYIKLESFFDREMSQIKGQCEEIATIEDRKRFPNQ